MHRLQQHILGKLLHNELQRYADLKPDEIEGNLFMYHLRRVITAGWVEKTSEGRYRLTGDGMRYVDGLSLATLNPRTQARLVTLLVIQNEQGDYYNSRLWKDPKAKSIYITKGDVIDGNKIVAELDLPFFVKPNQSGSSLGISMVSTLDDLPKALDFAFAEDNDILIESYLNGTEVSVGVLNYNGATKVLGITEILSQNAFFDYEAKYLGKSEEITPARISYELEKLVIETAKKVYESLGMIGFSRTDFIIMNGIPHFIEINTNPGLSPQSIFPQQATYANIQFSDLLDNEIKLALQRKPIWKK